VLTLISKRLKMTTMKKIGILLIATCLLCFGCNDFLEEDNRSAITTNDFYSTEAGFESLVNACYSTLRELYSDVNEDEVEVKNYTSMQGLTLLGTDLFCVGQESNSNSVLDGYYTLTPENKMVAKVFANCYKGIQLQNIAIEWSSKTVQSDALPTRVAEVRFLRAYFHFILVEFYGAIPIVTEAFDTPVTSFTRDSEEEVYAFIISELKDIINVLPEQPEAFGRASKGAAEHLLSLVYLSRGYTSFADAQDFANAEKYASNVINSNKYSLLSDFESVFKPGNEDNQEIIFSIQYDPTSLYKGLSGHGAHSWGGRNSSDVGPEAGNPYRHGQIRPTDKCYLQYDPADKRYESSFMTIKYVRYYDAYDENKPEEEKVIEFVYPHASIEDDPNNPSPDNWVFLEEYTVFVPGEWEDTNYPWVKKFDDPTSATRSDNTRDIFLFRLAETYLIRAEALINQGKSGDADINKVRERSWDVQVANADLDDVLDERGRELMGECKRWLDLRRMGKVKERVSIHNPSVKNHIDAGNSPFGEMDGKALKRPIPTDAIIRDTGDFGQNVGY